MAVSPDGPWPVLGLFLFPHGHMVVDEVGEMVGHQVLARAPHVHWVPELELSPEFQEDTLLDSGLGVLGILEEDVVPDFRGQVGWSE